MKLKIIFLLVLYSFTNIYAYQVETLKIDSKILDEERELLISVPKLYKQSNKKYEVVYVFDAQNREYFDAVKNTIQFQDYNLVPMIVVGIISPNRNQDFLPEVNHIETKESLAMTGYGNAENFKKFIKEEVFSKTEETYRTLPRKLGIGYSNGATFLNYAFINDPDFFDVYFFIDANLGFDKRQLQNSLNKSDIDNQINDSKFIYACSTNQNNDWVNAAKDYYTLINQKLGSKIIFNKDFFPEESHKTVFQQAIINAFKSYFRYQYFNANHLVKYYKNIEESKAYQYSEEEIISTAKAFNNNGLKNQAKIVIDAFDHKLTHEYIKNTKDLIGLFESGSMFLDLGYKKTAKQYFDVCATKLEQFKPYMSKQQYEMGKKMLKEKLSYFN